MAENNTATFEGSNGAAGTPPTQATDTNNQSGQNNTQTGGANTARTYTEAEFISEVDRRVSQAQAKWAKGVPEVPGSYYTPRHINNAFRAVCIKEDADEPRETILQYARIINDEIYDKRTEFGLPTLER